MSAGVGSRSDICRPPLAADISSLVHEAMERLKNSPYLPLRQLTCRGKIGVLALSGRVPTLYLKLVLALLGDLGRRCRCSTRSKSSPRENSAGLRRLRAVLEMPGG